jgi:hypothetical protein
VEIVFYVDVFMNMIQSYYKPNGKLETSFKAVIKEYLKTYFLIDFLSCFPFYLLLADV